MSVIVLPARGMLITEAADPVPLLNDGQAMALGLHRDHPPVIVTQQADTTVRIHGDLGFER